MRREVGNIFKSLIPCSKEKVSSKRSLSLESLIWWVLLKSWIESGGLGSESEDGGERKNIEIPKNFHVMSFSSVFAHFILTWTGDDSCSCRNHFLRHWLSELPFFLLSNQQTARRQSLFHFTMSRTIKLHIIYFHFYCEHPSERTKHPTTLVFSFHWNNVIIYSESRVQEHFAITWNFKKFNDSN